MKATLYIASTLNGLMTEGKTNTSWVSEHDEIMFAKTCNETGCILVGRQTFDQFQGVGGFAKVRLTHGLKRKKGNENDQH